jgi:hypothetical protein
MRSKSSATKLNWQFLFNYQAKFIVKRQGQQVKKNLNKELEFVLKKHGQ